MSKEFLYQFISQQKYAIMSSVSADNKPQSACVGFATTPELSLIFDTLVDSRKYRNLLNNPHISFVIGWEDGQTVQYQGIARTPSDRELNEFLSLYFLKFPDGIERKNNFNAITYFVVEPTWARYSDFNESLPKIMELTF